MKKWMRWLIAGGIFAALFFGGCCSKEEESENEVTAGDVIDYAIGKTPIEQGRRMKEDFKGIQKEHDEQLKWIIEETE